MSILFEKFDGPTALRWLHRCLAIVWLVLISLGVYANYAGSTPGIGKLVLYLGMLIASLSGTLTNQNKRKRPLAILGAVLTIPSAALVIYLITNGS